MIVLNNSELSIVQDYEGLKIKLKYKCCGKSVKVKVSDYDGYKDELCDKCKKDYKYINDVKEKSFGDYEYINGVYKHTKCGNYLDISKYDYERGLRCDKCDEEGYSKAYKGIYGYSKYKVMRAKKVLNRSEEYKLVKGEYVQSKKGFKVKHQECGGVVKVNVEGIYRGKIECSVCKEKERVIGWIAEGLKGTGKRLKSLNVKLNSKPNGTSEISKIVYEIECNKCGKVEIDQKGLQWLESEGKLIKGINCEGCKVQDNKNKMVTEYNKVKKEGYSLKVEEIKIGVRELVNYKIVHDDCGKVIKQIKNINQLKTLEGCIECSNCKTK